MAIAPRVSFNPKHAMPEVAYHYTTATGFQAILENRRLRATNFSFLNDPSELQYGRELVEQMLVERLDTSEALHRAFFEFVVSSFGTEMAAEVYVSCFTKLEDDLSQWRAYGNSSGERYAIGFDSEALDRLATPQSGASLHRVEYEKPNQRERIDSVFDRSVAFLNSHRISARRLAPFAEAAAKRLARIMPTLKNSAYRREEEWRVVVWSSRAAQRPQFDSSRGVVRPYMFFHLGFPLPIVKVHVMAPTRREVALKAAAMLLSTNGVHVEPEHSLIPFAD